MRLPEFEHFQPTSLDEALGLLDEWGGEARVIAGGTDLLVNMKLGLLAPRALINLKRIADLDFIETDDGGLRIGALTRLDAIAHSPLVGERFPVVVQAAGHVGAMALQDMGTLGGNLCQDTRCLYYNQSELWREEWPACYKLGGEVCNAVKGSKRCLACYQGDLAPVLVALGATARVVRPGGERVIPVAELFTGQGERPIALEPAEVLAEVWVPAANGQGAAYRRLAYRSAMDHPLAGVAAVVGANGATRVVLTAVAQGPVVVEASADDAPEAAFKAARPVDNVGSKASYRRKMVRVLTRRAVEDATERLPKSQRLRKS